MVKERVLAVPYITIFIARLSRETKNIIREDLMQYTKETDIILTGIRKQRIMSG